MFRRKKADEVFVEEPRPDTDDPISLVLWELRQSRREMRIAKQIADDAHRIAWAAILSAAIALAVGLGGAILFLQVRQAQMEIEETQVAVCENGNNTRLLNNMFWSYLIEVSSTSPGNQDPRIQQFFDEFDAAIDEGYNQRSCDKDDLDKVYEPPDFPEIPDPSDLE